MAPLLARHDAISAVARDTYRVLAVESDIEVLALTYRNDYPEVRSRIVSDLSAMLLDPVFLAADVIIYQFGIYAPLFDAILTGNGKARQIVCFHNVTPAQFLGPECRPVIERSFRQIEILRGADEIWTYSRVSAEVLLSRGFDSSRIRVVPLPVEAPRLALLLAKRTPIELLFVGRIVPSKGVLDLVRAVERMHRQTAVPFRLRIVGNHEFSDKGYVTQVRAAINGGGLGHLIDVVGTVDDTNLEQLYHKAHIVTIPSYHEGFCKPVIEAFRAGCVPIGYAAYNLPYITNGLGRMVPPGEIKLLAEALLEMVEGVTYGIQTPVTPSLPVDRGLLSVADFDMTTKAYAENFSLSRSGQTIVERVCELCRHLAIGDDFPNWHPACHRDSAIASALHRVSQRNSNAKGYG